MASADVRFQQPPGQVTQPFVGGRGGGPNYGPYGGPNAGPYGGPNAGPSGGPNPGPYAGANANPYGGANANPYGGAPYGGAALGELIASWLAHDRSRQGHYLSSRVPKMAAYGAFISAPMGHFLIGLLQFFFADRTSLRAKILQILTSNLIIAPIQNTVYLASMAVIAGARTWHQIRATIRAGFMPVMKVSWITSPIALAFAQNFLPEQTWVPFFNIVAFCIGTYINTHTKKKRLAALRRKHYGDSRPPTVGGNGRPDEGY
ncbi:hypothetical protein DV736_g5505, partial [Chaetothyriales sp. CBS 134916]